MVEIIPNWHPIFVHFTIGLLLTGGVLFLVANFLKHSDTGARITTAARWNLAIGAASAVVTIATGYQAYYSVGHDTESHAAMTIHLKWAWTALILYVMAAFLAWRDRRRAVGASLALSVVLLGGLVALAMTGYLGGENVFRHGIGVMRLPETAGPGHAHSHDDNDAHEQGDRDVAADAGHGDGHAHGDTPSSGTATSGHSHAAPETPEDVLEAFHHALAEGNAQAVLDFLTEDAVILEGGVAETKAEYASHHLASDMAFLDAMQATGLSREVMPVGDIVIVITRTQLKGRFNDREIDIVSSESAVLKRTEAGWRIQHLHWSN